LLPGSPRIPRRDHRGLRHNPVMGTLLLIGGAVALSYLVSLRLHPNRGCRRCKSTGKQFGSVYSRTHRQCVACGGNGRRARLGVRVFHPGRANWGERKPDETSARRGRNFGR
jgi:hypothetical protein